MSDKLQFVARNDKLKKLIEHQTDPPPSKLTVCVTGNQTGTLNSASEIHLRSHLRKLPDFAPFDSAVGVLTSGQFIKD